jgi:hypothetical protein
MLNKLIRIALKEVGYLEKKSNASLDSKTANAGNKNYTKYARDMSKYHAGIFANGYAWCDTFVDWCFTQAFGADKAKKLLNGWSAYCPTSAGYFKNQHRWYTKPQKGDIIFYKDSKGVLCHTGIVYKVDTGYVYTVEGNTSSASGVVANGGAVEKKKYALSYNRIAGYGRPDYALVKCTTIGAVVDELNRRGIITDTKLWLKKFAEDKNCKALAIKCIEQTIDCSNKKELVEINDIVWELEHMGIMAAKDYWLSKLQEDTAAYWLARKIAHKTE